MSQKFFTVEFVQRLLESWVYKWDHIPDLLKEIQNICKAKIFFTGACWFFLNGFYFISVSTYFQFFQFLLIYLLWTSIFQRFSMDCFLTPKYTFANNRSSYTNKIAIQSKVYGMKMEILKKKTITIHNAQKR